MHLRHGNLICCVGWLGFVAAVVFLAGCGSKSATDTAEEPPAQGAPGKTAGGTPKRKPSISANPNPVPAGEEKLGKTTISWDTGDGTPGEVYLSTNRGEEKRFSGAVAKGSQEAAWIGKGEYEFKLYAGKGHATLLASVKVTRNK